MFEKRMLRRIFEENCIMRRFKIYTPRQIRMMKSKKMRWARYVALMGENRNAQSSGGTLDGNSLLRKPSHRWKDNI
jgi:hypothetical protein